MSRVGEKPISMPSGVTCKVNARQVEVSGPKGKLTWTHPPTAKVTLEDSLIKVARTDDAKQSRANHGLTRSLIANMIEGVSNGFEIKLQIYGTGYGCKLQGRTLQLNVGFMGRKARSGAQFDLTVPDGVEVTVERDQARGETDPAQLTIKGIDKQKVGQFAAEIRALRKTEPYKGKGIRYLGEQVRRKQGKALTGGG